MESSSKRTAESPPAAQGFFGAIAGAFSSVRQILADFVELVTIEIRRAGLTLVWMVALGAVSAMLIVAAWLCLMAVLALWLVSQGVAWIGAIVLVALLNLLAAAVAAFFCVRLSRNLLLPATQRQLKARASPSDTA